MAVLPKRFARYQLTIHPEKTKLVQFGKTESPGDRDWERHDPVLEQYQTLSAKLRVKGELVSQKSANSYRLGEDLDFVISASRPERRKRVEPIKAILAALQGWILGVNLIEPFT